MQTIRRVVGRIAKPHGVRGELQVEVRTDEPEVRFQVGATLLMEETSVKLEAVKIHGKYLIVKFEGFNTRNDVEELRNRLLEVEVNIDDVPNDEDEFYDYQLVGLRVLVNSEVIGVTKEVLHLPAQDVLVVTQGDQEVLVPFVKEIVTEVHLADKYLVMKPPPGLLEDIADED